MWYSATMHTTILDKPQVSEQGELFTDAMRVNPEAVTPRHNLPAESQLAIDVARQIIAQQRLHTPKEPKSRLGY